MSAIPCPLHSGSYTRNTAGAYSSFAPACSGCPRGDQEAAENTLITRIQILDNTLRTNLENAHPTELLRRGVRDLYEAILDLEERTTLVPTPCEYGRRTIQLWEETRALYCAVVRYRADVTNTETKSELRWAVQSFTGSSYTQREAQRIVDSWTPS